MTTCGRSDLQSMFGEFGASSSNPDGWVVIECASGYVLTVRLPDGTLNSFMYESFEDARDGVLLMVKQTTEGRHGGL